VLSKQVTGSLWQHCTPPNLDGLFSQNANSYPDRVEPGWDALCLYGNFVLISTDWWYREDVQRFLDLVLATGAHYRFRWNEQAVIGMAWQLFCPLDNFFLYNFEYEHPYPLDEVHCEYIMKQPEATPVRHL
jgi:hypothetical protein